MQHTITLANGRKCLLIERDNALDLICEPTRPGSPGEAHHYSLTGMKRVVHDLASRQHMLKGLCNEPAPEDYVSDYFAWELSYYQGSPVWRADTHIPECREDTPPAQWWVKQISGVDGYLWRIAPSGRLTDQLHRLNLSVADPFISPVRAMRYVEALERRMLDKLNESRVRLNWQLTLTKLRSNSRYLAESSLPGVVKGKTCVWEVFPTLRADKVGWAISLQHAPYKEEDLLQELQGPYRDAAEAQQMAEQLERRLLDEAAATTAEGPAAPEKPFELDWQDYTDLSTYNTYWMAVSRYEPDRNDSQVYEIHRKFLGDEVKFTATATFKLLARVKELYGVLLEESRWLDLEKAKQEIAFYESTILQDLRK